MFISPAFLLSVPRFTCAVFPSRVILQAEVWVTTSTPAMKAVIGDCPASGQRGSRTNMPEVDQLLFDVREDVPNMSKHWQGVSRQALNKTVISHGFCKGQGQTPERDLRDNCNTTTVPAVPTRPRNAATQCAPLLLFCAQQAGQVKCEMSGKQQQKAERSETHAPSQDLL